MKHLFAILLLAGLFFSACRKEKNYPSEIPDTIVSVSIGCKQQTQNPLGRSYSGHSVFPFPYSQKNCGLLPLSTKNYWVYQDSLFIDGLFSEVKYDTLRFNSTWKSLPDGLIWWSSNITIGLPELLYTNDSTFFALQSRLFSSPVLKDAKRDFSLFTGDSIHYLTNFEHLPAEGRSIKLYNSVKTPAGSFRDCVYFEKYAPDYRKDQVFFKPGLGVLKYIVEDAPMGESAIKLQRVSILVAYHIE